MITLPMIKHAALDNHIQILNMGVLKLDTIVATAMT